LEISLPLLTPPRGDAVKKIGSRNAEKWNRPMVMKGLEHIL
jgi:hypothetical protein